MNRRDLFFKWLFYGVASLIFILLQSFVFNHLSVMQTHPFVFPLLAATVAVLEPHQENIPFCFALGILCDLTIPGMIPCFYTVSFLLIALLSTLISKRLILPGFWCCLTCGALSIVLCDILNILIICNRHSTSFESALALAGRELLLSVILIPLLYIPFRQICLYTKQD